MVGPYNEPPFRVEAIVIEDDTYNVLSANPEFQASRTTIREAMAGLEQIEPHPLGAIVVKPGRPLIFQAIVHDLSRDQSCSEASVRRALAAVFVEAERRALQSVALAPIGTRYRSLDEARFLGLFNETLATATCRSVEQVWLVVPEGFGG